MLCKSPYMINGMACPCTRCLPCRFNKRRTWTHRIVLESMSHSDNSFLTLTYDDDHLPSGGTLVPRDTQLFLKRLRKAFEPLKIRYYLVGEYGGRFFGNPQAQRDINPHYHAALFGVPVSALPLVKLQWPYGGVDLGELTRHSAQYIAGYTVKKMTSDNDKRLYHNGVWLHPEFARMSLRPGVGATSVDSIIKSFQSAGGIDYVIKHGDIPRSLMCDGKNMPIGRYMRRLILKGLGLYDMETGEIGTAPLRRKILEAYKEELQILFDASEDKTLSKKEVIVKHNAQKILNLETRTKLYSKDKIL